MFCSLMKETPMMGFTWGLRGVVEPVQRVITCIFDEDDEDVMSSRTPDVEKGKSKQSASHPDSSARTKKDKSDATSSLTTEISQMMGKFLETYKDVAGTLAINMGEGLCDREVEKSAKAFEIFGAMEFLTELQRFNIATKLTANTKKMDLFSCIVTTRKFPLAIILIE